MRSKRLFWASVFCVTAVACASPPLESSFASGTGLTAGKHLDSVWFNREAIRSASFATVRLLSVRGAHVSDIRNVTVAQAEAWLREALAGAGSDSVVVSTGGAGPAANLEVAITELDPGSTVARFWAGEVGAGHAWVQVEARLTDPATETLIGVLVQRSRASGVLTLRNSRDSDSGPGLVRDLLESIARAIKLELAAELRGAATQR